MWALGLIRQPRSIEDDGSPGPGGDGAFDRLVGGGATQRRARGRPPPPLAALSRGVRCVCKAWHDVVDARRLPRAELLPLSLGGIFINFNNYYISEFLARPSTTVAARLSISGKHDYLPDAGTKSWSKVLDHCNGLLLVVDYDVLDRRLEYVLNPATRWCVPLPPCPPPRLEINTMEDKYLVYDPTISPHYQVFSVTRLLYNESTTATNLILILP
ncbi:hypothetical protein PR202_gb11474 [Eleusine coracana subsp. coracana]|uniref:F-box protein n=1 Tax=Eleusine coracana subsp. coracana TaxID=191504 RepID=A0AAV5EML8_ELECO|nr:hypothetical protein PR202_gb11474 [Eleusine coracana subsp. coracana]